MQGRQSVAFALNLMDLEFVEEHTTYKQWKHLITSLHNVHKLILK